MKRNTKIAVYVAAFLPILAVSMITPSSAVVDWILMSVTFIHMCVMLVVLGARGSELIGFIPYVFQDISLLALMIENRLWTELHDVEMYKEGVLIHYIDFQSYNVLERISWFCNILTIVSVVFILIRRLVIRKMTKEDVEGDMK